jgi:fumarylacetoacetate (FAA) hydrolase
MILATFSGQDGERKPGVVRNGRVYALPFPDMQAVIKAGVEAAESQVSSTPLHIAHVTFHAPLRPTTLRDGYAFEQHVKTANANRGREVPKEWYSFPVFYFTNPNSIYGPNEEIPYPHYTSELDYELEIAAVIGKGGRNIKPEDAPRHIFGFTIFNDWSARDIQREEMIVGLGPAKGKDFASSLGPYLVTLDELAERATGRPGVFDMPMYARINGQERSRGNMKDLYWSFGDIIARASDSADLQPGDVIGSGTVGTGCLLELTKRQGPWLQPGDVVELEIEGIGVLRNQVGPRPS